VTLLAVRAGAALDIGDIGFAAAACVGRAALFVRVDVVVATVADGSVVASGAVVVSVVAGAVSTVGAGVVVAGGGSVGMGCVCCASSGVEERPTTAAIADAPFRAEYLLWVIIRNNIRRDARTQD
jgi:hypothetical protein